MSCRDRVVEKDQREEKIHFMVEQEQNENKRDKSTEEEERGIIWDKEEAGSPGDERKKDENNSTMTSGIQRKSQ